MLARPGLVASLAAGSLVACLNATALSSELPTLDVAGADNAFGFRLLNAVQKEEPRANVVLSPASAALDLAMALNGASGETAKEIAAVLALDGASLEQINTANADLIATLRAPPKDVTLSVADSLWTDRRRVTLLSDYVDRTRRWYDAEIREVDFGNPDT